MNLMIAAGLFENPWVIAVILIVGGIANWLSQRRQHKLDQAKQLEEDPSTTPEKPAEAFDVEAALRRLLGEEPAPPPPPPPLIRPAQAPPADRWREDLDGPLVPVRPVLPSPPRVPALSVKRSTEGEGVEGLEAVVRRYQFHMAPIGSTVPIVDRRHARRSRGQGRYGWNWRDQKSARQAFVASLVFGPPKGLEP